MKYIAVDVETTGLDLNNDQILEFAAVATTLGDNSVNLYDLPTFHTYVVNDRIMGHPYALMMNAVAIERIAKQTPGFNYTHISSLAASFYDWCCDFNVGELEKEHYRMTLTVAGKNYGMFDHHFIDRIPEWSRFFKINHRVIDPATLYMRPGDKKLPSLSECLERAGIAGTVLHTAASDAYQTIELIRSKYPWQL